MKKKFFLLVSILLMFLPVDDKNNFKTIIIYNETKLSVASDAGFNDDNFYGCVVEYYNNKNSASLTINDSLTDEQLSTIDELICKNKGVSDITGIEKLTNLTALNLMENNLANVDLRQNTKLKHVELSGNPKITSIDLSNNTALEEIYFKHDSLKNIDLSANTELRNLDLHSNELTSINLTNNKKLKYVVLSNNKLSNVDLSNNTNLIQFSADDNNINSLILPNTDTLELLKLKSNELTSIDLTNNGMLKEVELSGNPKITSINLSNNTALEEIAFKHDSLKNIDLSTNTKLRSLNLDFNELTSINLANNRELEYVVLSNNKLPKVDLSNNTKLVEFSAANNKINSLILPNTDTILKLDLHNNKISSIDVSKYTKLEKLSLSTNQLSNINLANNTDLKELYISSNNLQSLDLSKQLKLNYLNVVFNKFDALNIPAPQNIISLAVESAWIKSYDFSKFPNLASIRVVDYYVIPVYGTKFEVSSLSNYKSSNVNYTDSILYSDFNKRDNEYINSSSTINGKLGTKLQYTVCSTNIKGNHNTCGNDLENNDKFQVDNNVIINELSNFSKIVFYEGYREFRFMNLSSDVYVIDNDNNTIDVSGDDDSTILSNLSVSFDDAVIKIAGNKLSVYYSNDLLKEYTLLRVENAPTGDLNIYLIGTILIVSVSLIIYFVFKKKY